MTSQYAEIAKSMSVIEGMINDFEAALMDCLLSYQASEKIFGDLMEFGNYKGKSAVILAYHVRPSEKLTLVDIVDRGAKEKIVNITDKVESLVMSSESYQAKACDMRELDGSVRVLHFDDSHTFSAMTSDMFLAEQLCSPGGMVILDDFVNNNYPQVQAATYAYLFSRESRLRLFLISGTKAYLCDESYWKKYVTFTRTKLLEEMLQRGIESPSISIPPGPQNPILAKTDHHPVFSVYTIRNRKPQENSRIYLENIYGHFFSD